jgi:hypothetical protein
LERLGSGSSTGKPHQEQQQRPHTPLARAPSAPPKPESSPESAIPEKNLSAFDTPYVRDSDGEQHVVSPPPPAAPMQQQQQQLQQQQQRQHLGLGLNLQPPPPPQPHPPPPSNGQLKNTFARKSLFWQLLQNSFLNATIRCSFWRKQVYFNACANVQY